MIDILASSKLICALRNAENGYSVTLIALIVCILGLGMVLFARG
jgi:hypothetical protein